MVEKQRIILTVVGTSLIDKLAPRTLIEKAKKDGCFTTARTTHDVVQRIQYLESALKNQTIRLTPEAAARFDNVQTNWPDGGAGYVVEWLCYLWGSAEETAVAQRKHSSAEQAGLSLLQPRLTRGDEVRLLYSETVDSAVCSAILAQVLTRLSEQDAACCGRDVQITQTMLKGVQIKDAARLLHEGLPTWVEVIEQAQRDAAASDRQVWLNITGGYKGLAPLSTLLAFGLSDGRPIKVVYLYEESDALLELPAHNLIRFDLTIFDGVYRKIWQELPDEGLGVEQCRELGSDFFEEIVAGRADLLTVIDGKVDFTVTGRLLWQTWKARNARVGPAPLPRAL